MGDDYFFDEHSLSGKAYQAAHMAQYWHFGQVDKAGNDYFRAHVADVWKRVSHLSDTAQCVALLHDVLEDTDCTEEELRRTMSDDVVEAVVAITHHPHEPRDEYYARVKANPWALIVKQADIGSNTEPARMALLDDATRERLTTKYRHALEVLAS